MSVPLPIVQRIILQSPLHLIWLAGIVMARLSREEHPRGSSLVSMALALLLLDAIFGAYLTLVLPKLLEQQFPSSTMQILLNLILYGSLRLSIQVLSWSLLLFCMFNWRTNR